MLVGGLHPWKLHISSNPPALINGISIIVKCFLWSKLWLLINIYVNSLTHSQCFSQSNNEAHMMCFTPNHSRGKGRHTHSAEPSVHLYGRIRRESCQHSAAIEGVRAPYKRKIGSYLITEWIWYLAAKLWIFLTYCMSFRKEKNIKWKIFLLWNFVILKSI